LWLWRSPVRFRLLAPKKLGASARGSWNRRCTGAGSTSSPRGGTTDRGWGAIDGCDRGKGRGQHPSDTSIRRRATLMLYFRILAAAGATNLLLVTGAFEPEKNLEPGNDLREQPPPCPIEEPLPIGKFPSIPAVLGFLRSRHSGRGLRGARPRPVSTEHLLRRRRRKNPSLRGRGRARFVCRIVISALARVPARLGFLRHSRLAHCTRTGSDPRGAARARACAATKR
jgi:hypothetical protein